MEWLEPQTGSPGVDEFTQTGSPCVDEFSQTGSLCVDEFSIYDTIVIVLSFCSRLEHVLASYLVSG